jgi:exodeoxyribonuclease V alpha subunit
MQVHGAGNRAHGGRSHPISFYRFFGGFHQFWVIFRQEGQSGIIENSHKILQGQPPVGSTDKGGDFFIIQCKTPERALEMVREVVQKRIPSRFGLDPRRDIQVLTPMHRGPVGTISLNQVLQNDLNPSGRAMKGEGQQFRVGDKVLQLKNNYDKSVFNGDLGEVMDVQDEPASVVVRFESDEGERHVTYERADMAQLGLAYATSIHKSQGSEYSAVVIPFLTSHFVMLSRNLLYTAVTRAKKLCVLVADQRAISIALGETRRELRTTGLSARLFDTKTE